MIVGSFLVKNLLIHWHYGHVGLTNVSLMQIKLIILLVGSGLQVPDAAPYFRIFNPITQGQNFDEEGIYTKKWVPELSKIPNKYLFNPWEVFPDILNAANLELEKITLYQLLISKNLEILLCKLLKQ